MAVISNEEEKKEWELKHNKAVLDYLQQIKKDMLAVVEGNHSLTMDEDYRYLSRDAKDDLYAETTAHFAVSEKIDELIKEYEAKI